MNKYQKIAFGAPVALAVAFIIALVYGIDGLGLTIIVTLVIALHTLPVTWRIIFGVIQMVGAILAFTGHTVGKVGDVIADAAFVRRQGLSTSSHKVPDWDNPNLVTSASSNESRGFLDDALQPYPAS